MMTEQTDTTNEPGETGSTTIPMDWKQMIPSDVQEWDEFKNSDSAEKFFQQMASHRAMLGQSVRIPGEEAGDDQRSEFYTKIMNKVPDLMRTPDIDNDEVMGDVWSRLGRPEAADGYGDPTVDDYTPAEGQLSKLKEIAHKAGLTKKQFQSMALELITADAAAHTAAKDHHTDDQKSLASEWGAALDHRTKAAAAIARQTGAPESLLQMVEGGEADSKTMQWLFTLSQQMGGEGNPIANQDPNMMAPAELQGQIDDIMNNNDHPYWNKNHAGHDRAVEKMVDLRRKLA